ncbi:metallopeptidase family protein [Roseibium sp. RKSG952]|uniref:metallopeptidase family protein n=1 Tax=Roseibium sp. RKSG952 TaxID=2529384 RepID=UPI0012BCEB74|nr:metallopeptidase family protein [Roseibium sp. RKSG952]MTH98190.1 metallopeptidase family protein [Roseibium sp. RKSG952]
MASMHPFRSDWSDRRAPALDVFQAIASEVLANMPDEFLAMCGNIEIRMTEYAQDEMLDSLGIEDPNDLLGLFQGRGLAQGAAELHTGQMPNRIWLFRRPILDYWAAGEDTLGEVVAHVLIHEIGHHFGLSDDDMEQIEAAAD